MHQKPARGTANLVDFVILIFLEHPGTVLLFAGCGGGAHVQDPIINCQLHVFSTGPEEGIIEKVY
jgi:hypothetical protein